MVCFVHFDLLRATTACTCWTCQRPKVIKNGPSMKCFYILVAISSIKWSHPGTLLNHFFRHYKMENRMFGVVLEWFIRICFIYFLFGQVLLYRGHLGSYCRKAVHLVGVAQASTL